MATYYVATTGNDTTGDGSSGNPWATATYGLTQVLPGDTLVLTAGNHGGVTVGGSAVKGTGWGDGEYVTVRAEGEAILSFLDINANADFYMVFDGLTVQAQAGESDYCVRFQDCQHVKLQHMDISGFWSQNFYSGCTDKGISFSTSIISYRVGYITIEDCEIYNVGDPIAIGNQLVAPANRSDVIITIRNNTIRDFGGTSISLNCGSQTLFTHGRVIVDNNHMYRKHTSVYYVRMTGDITGEFIAGEAVTQVVGGGTMTGVAGTSLSGGEVVDGEGRNLFAPTHDTLSFELIDAYGVTGTPNPIIGSVSGATLTNPTYKGVEATHGSGISLRIGNAEITNNTIRDLGPTRGIRLYQDTNTATVTGYNDVVMTGNLVYDIINNLPVELGYIGDNFVFSDNIVVSRYADNQAPFRITPDRYGGALTIAALTDGKDGSGLTMENNVLVGALSISDSITGTPVIQNNIMYSCIDNRIQKYTYRASLGEPEDENIILCYGTSSFLDTAFVWSGFQYTPDNIDENFFDTSNLLFVGGDDFEIWHARSVTEVVHPYEELDGRPSGVDLDDAYQLARYQRTTTIRFGTNKLLFLVTRH